MSALIDYFIDRAKIGPAPPRVGGRKPCYNLRKSRSGKSWVVYIIDRNNALTFKTWTEGVQYLSRMKVW
jgi:hypothetical protein